MTDPAPTLDPRTADELADGLLARVAGYVPGWAPAPGGKGWAVVHIYAGFLRALAERLNAAPDKNRLAFLDSLGLGLMPAQAARAPVAFRSLPGIGDTRVPAGSRLGATRDGTQIGFETESDVALAAAELTDVVAVWPGRDQYADHSAAARAGDSFTLFDHLRPIPHEVYFGHATHLALSGKVTLEIRFDLARPSPRSLGVTWEYTDGSTWRPFQPFGDEASNSFDGTNGLTRSGVIRLSTGCAEAASMDLRGVTTCWVRARLNDPLPAGPAEAGPTVARVGLRPVIDRTSAADVLAPDAAFADGTKLDTTKPFRPLGPAPSPGSVFYLLCKGALSKPGAVVRISTTLSSAAPDASTPVVDWQYWDGTRWVGLSPGESTKGVKDFRLAGSLSFTVPPQLSSTQVNGQEGPWIRAVLTAGGYLRNDTLDVPTGQAAPNDKIHVPIKVPVPPQVSTLTIGYTFRPPVAPPEACLSWNDFQWHDLTSAAHGNDGFVPFIPTGDVTPALYLGFDKPLPADRIGLYIGVREEPGRETGPPLRWEAWTGREWLPVAAADDTGDLALPGVVSVTWPGTDLPEPATVLAAAGTTIHVMGADQTARFKPGDELFLSRAGSGELVTVAAVAGATVTVRSSLAGPYPGGTLGPPPLPRFGVPRTWLRARLREDGEPPRPTIDSIRSNATWAAQTQAAGPEILGSGDGTAGQVFFSRSTPVLDGEVVEVREMDGPRAAVELPMLLDDLAANGRSPDDVRTVTDRRTGRVAEVWVRWQRRPFLMFSGPGDRHYSVERSRGRFAFGDGRTGRVVPPGRDNVRLAAYRTGGGAAGNLPAGAIRDLLSGVTAKSVANLRPAEGGADTESPVTAARRGPALFRHRRQAITAADYEALALEASPAVAVARAVPAGGSVTVQIIPHAIDPRPWPSFELRRRVLEFLRTRAPAAAADGVSVDGPNYFPVGLSAVVTPADPSDAGPTADRILRTAAVFLHPLTGGPDGTGWPAGRAMYLSDAAAVLEAVSGVDHVDELYLTVGGTPQGEVVAVRADRIVVAGDIRIRLAGAEAG